MHGNIFLKKSLLHRKVIGLDCAGGFVVFASGYGHTVLGEKTG